MQKANDHHTAVRLGKDKDMDFITNEEREAFWNREVPDDAQERACEVLEKSKHNDDPEKEVLFAEEYLRAGGIDMDSPKEVSIMLERVEGDLKSFWEEEARINQQTKEILLKSGVTELEMKWGNYSNARYSYMDRKRIRRLKKKHDENLKRNLPGLTMLEALCRNKERLEAQA